MTKSLFISIFLHTIAVAIMLIFFKHDSSFKEQNIKKISLSSIEIIKPTPKATKQEKRAKKIEITKKSKSETLTKVKKAQIEKATKKLLIKKAKAKKATLKKPKKSIKPIKKKVAKKTQKHTKKAHKKLPKLPHKRVIKTAHKAKLKHKSKHSKKLKAAKHSYQKRATYKQFTAPKRATTIPKSNIKAQVYRAINRAKVALRLARKMNLQGSVNTCFTLGTNRTVSNLSTTGAHPILQKGARQTINRAKNNFPIISNPIDLCITISYVLE